MNNRKKPEETTDGVAESVLDGLLACTVAEGAAIVAGEGVTEGTEDATIQGATDGTAEAVAENSSRWHA